MDSSTPSRRHTVTKERTFLANAAHELRTPLHSANGFLEMVLDGMAGPLNERQSEMLTYAHTAIGQLATLIEDVLFLARADSGELLPHPSTADPAMILGRALDSVRELARESNVTLELRETLLPPSIQVDGERLREGLAGLLRGGLALMPSGGVMFVDVSEQENQLEVAVTLEHVRLSAADLRHLFDRFYQPRPLDAERSTHLGLGLVIAQITARWHGGGVRAETTQEGNVILRFEAQDGHS
jgi:signal transduction histidine kinase